MEKIKFVLRSIVYIFSVFLTSIILPFAVFFQLRQLILNDAEFSAYLMKVDLIFFPLLFVGISITAFTSFIFFFEPYMYGRLGFSIITELLFIIQIILFSTLLDVYLNIGSIFIRIDLSKLYLIIIFIPIIIFIKNLFSFYNIRKLSIVRYVILKTIYNLKGESNKKKILKTFSKNFNLINKIEIKLRRNLSNFINEMEFSIQPFIVLEKGKFRITKKGYLIINYFDNFKLKSVKSNSFELEYWSIEDFD